MDSNSLCHQFTISAPASVAGVGYWSGQSVTVEFRPAAADEGITFVRRDLPGNPRVAALVSHREDGPRRTTLVAGACRVEMVEHVLAALAGLRIDNCEVWVDQPEMPGCDGSSLQYVEALSTAGRVTQSRPARVLRVTEVLRVGDGESWVELRPKADGFSIDYELDYGADSPIGRQSLHLELSAEAFQRELSPARTFLLDHEARWLQEQGLGRHVSYADLLVFNEHGPIDNTLRFSDECVRHKSLDLVGDFCLAGCRIIGQAHAYRSGHRLNAALIAKLLQRGQISQQLSRCA